jgi:nickel/cobalt transporter (NiCoT) family protein
MTISAILGYVIVGIFIAAWLLSYVIYRLNRYDEIEVYPAGSIPNL